MTLKEKELILIPGARSINTLIGQRKKLDQSISEQTKLRNEIDEKIINKMIEVGRESTGELSNGSATIEETGGSVTWQQDQLQGLIINYATKQKIDAAQLTFKLCKLTASDTKATEIGINVESAKKFSEIKKKLKIK